MDVTKDNSLRTDLIDNNNTVLSDNSTNDSKSFESADDNKIVSSKNSKDVKTNTLGIVI